MTKPFILDLIKDMTIEEKLAQLTQLSPIFFGCINSSDPTGPMNQYNVNDEIIMNIGSVLGNIGAQKFLDLQKEYLASNRHKIPFLIMSDIIHGFRTIFPIPIAMGCSFNLDSCRQSAEIAALEGSVSGVSVTFSPMADLVRDPRWGRTMESPGEDPYLNACITKSMVEGYQGDSIASKGKMAACIKHFAGYGAGEAGREYNTVDISEGMLLEYYMPAYKAAIDAGVALAMTSFNTIDRIPASSNQKLLDKILRKEWGFDGVVISDYNAVDETISHGTSADPENAALKCLTAGLDIEMMSTHYLTQGKKLVEKGLLDEKIIDQSVIRVLELKDALGLFENPYKDADPELEKKLHLCPEHRQAARQIGAESAVLLKNNTVLPLKPGMKIGLAGPFALSHNVLGGWSFAPIEDSIMLYDGIAGKTEISNIITAMTDELGSMQQGHTDVPDHIGEAYETLKDCDVIIAAVGESPQDTGESTSKTNLRLTPNQERLIWKLKETGKPVITIVFSGRPLEIQPICDASDAIIQAWFLGTESGNALADILFGDYNPSARLSMSMPYTVGQIPVYYNEFQTGRPYIEGKVQDRFTSKYLDCPNEPLYCFGYGLSYSKFIYDDFDVEWKDGHVTASISILNDSEYAGKETVQLYIRDICAQVVRPIKELKDFRQLTIAPHEKKTVRFTITKEMLMYHNENLEFIFEPGEFDIMIGKNSEDVFSKRVYIDQIEARS